MIVHSRVSKIIIESALSVFVVSMSVYFHLRGEDKVFPHLYWLPVILLVIWWGYRGWFFALLLIFTLPITHLISDIEIPVFCGLRAVSLIVLSFVFAMIVHRQKTAKRLLKESEEKYSGFFRTSNDCVFIVSNEGKIIEINDACLNLFEYEDTDDLLNMNLVDLCEDKHLIRKHFQQVQKQGFSKEFELNLKKKNSKLLNALITTVQRKDEQGNVIGYQGTIRDISRQRQLEENREKIIRELQAALKSIETLKCMLPICSSCKKIRDDSGYWHEVEEYVRKHSEAEFTHGICPECMSILYPEYAGK